MIKAKENHYFVINEKTGEKYIYNPEGLHIGEETFEKIIYTGIS